MARLRHAVVCPNVTAKTKERIARSGLARARPLAIVDCPQVARTCAILRAFLFCLPMPYCLLWRFVLFYLSCFCFVFVCVMCPFLF